MLKCKYWLNFTFIIQPVLTWKILATDCQRNCECGNRVLELPLYKIGQITGHADHHIWLPMTFIFGITSKTKFRPANLGPLTSSRQIFIAKSSMHPPWFSKSYRKR